MSDQATTTLTEAFQRVTGRDSCPYLMECDGKITKGYVVRFCISLNYVNCHHLAKMMGDLKCPLYWVWHLAKEQEKGSRNLAMGTEEDL